MMEATEQESTQDYGIVIKVEPHNEASAEMALALERILNHSLHSDSEAQAKFEAFIEYVVGVLAPVRAGGI